MTIPFEPIRGARFYDPPYEPEDALELGVQRGEVTRAQVETVCSLMHAANVAIVEPWPSPTVGLRLHSVVHGSWETSFLMAELPGNRVVFIDRVGSLSREPPR